MVLYTAAELFTWMNQCFLYITGRKASSVALFILTLDKIAWILFNRKINMNKSLQSLLRQGFHGISNKLPNSNSACLQNMQTKALLQDQTKNLPSVQHTD